MELKVTPRGEEQAGLAAGKPMPHGEKLLRRRRNDIGLMALSTSSFRLLISMSPSFPVWNVENTFILVLISAPTVIFVDFLFLQI